MIYHIDISMPLLTHIAKTQNKRVADKYWKINNQAIYNSAVNPFTRAIIVENMHAYIISHVPISVRNLKLKRIIGIKYVFHTVMNHGDVSRRVGKLCWKPAKNDYQTTWDLNNMSDFWIKTGNDALVHAGVLIDDNAGVIHDTRYKFVTVPHIDDLKLNITITYNTEENG